MTPKVRQGIYIVAFVLAVVVATLVLFGIVDTAQVSTAIGVLALVFGAVAGLAAMNVNR